jgi:hypothetical protein
LRAGLGTLRVSPLLTLSGLLAGLLALALLLTRLPTLLLTLALLLARLLTRLLALTLLLARLLALAPLLAWLLTWLLALLLARLPALLLAVLPLSRTIPLLLPVGHVLHTLSGTFYLLQGLSQLVITLAARLIALLLIVRTKRGLCLLNLIAQIVEASRYGRLTGPCVHALSTSKQVGRFPHAQVELVLLRLCQRIAQFRRSRRLRSGQIARSRLHLIFELLQILRHLLFFGGKAVHLLLALARLGTSIRRIAQRTLQTVLIVLLLLGEAIRLARHFVELPGGLIVAHAVQQGGGFLQTISRATLACIALLGVRFGAAHVLGCLAQPL